MHVTFDKTNDDISKSCCEDNDVSVQERFKKLTIQDEENAPLEEKSKEDDFQENQALEENDKGVSIPKDLPKVWKFVQNHPKELIIGDSSEKSIQNNFSKDSEWKIRNKLERLCVHPPNLTMMKKVRKLMRRNIEV